MKKNWDEKEVNFLKENYRKMPKKEIARELGRTLDGIRAKAFLLSLTKKIWTETEIEFLRNNYGKISSKKIEKIIGRGWQGILAKGKRLKLKSNRSLLLSGENNPMKNPEMGLEY